MAKVSKVKMAKRISWIFFGFLLRHGSYCAFCPTSTSIVCCFIVIRPRRILFRLNIIYRRVVLQLWYWDHFVPWLASFRCFRVHVVNNTPKLWLHKFAHKTDLFVRFFKNAGTFMLLFRWVQGYSFHSIAGRPTNSDIHFIIKIRFLNSAVNKCRFLAQLVRVGSYIELWHPRLHFSLRVSIFLRFLKELMFVFRCPFLFVSVAVRLLVVTVQVKMIFRRSIIAVVQFFFWLEGSYVRVPYRLFLNN